MLKVSRSIVVVPKVYGGPLKSVRRYLLASKQLNITLTLVTAVFIYCLLVILLFIIIMSSSFILVSIIQLLPGIRMVLVGLLSDNPRLACSDLKDWIEDYLVTEEHAYVQQ